MQQQQQAQLTTSSNMLYLNQENKPQHGDTDGIEQPQEQQLLNEDLQGASSQQHQQQPKQKQYQELCNSASNNNCNDESNSQAQRQQQQHGLYAACTSILTESAAASSGPYKSPIQKRRGRKKKLSTLIEDVGGFANEMSTTQDAAVYNPSVIRPAASQRNAEMFTDAPATGKLTAAVNQQCKLKERKKHERFNGMSEEEVVKRTLPDHLCNNLDIIIIGINPGLFAAYKGHHYAGPGNHFWKCLYLSGLTKEQMSSDDDYKLMQIGIGFTNMVQRATKGSADLTRKEIKEGSVALLDKLQRFRPKIAVFNGKLIFEVFSGKKDFNFGRQPEFVDGTDTHIWVMPSSSARCAQLPRAADKVPFYTALKRFRDYLNGLIPHIDDAECVFTEQRIKRVCEADSSRKSLKSNTDIVTATPAADKSNAHSFGHISATTAMASSATLAQQQKQHQQSMHHQLVGDVANEHADHIEPSFSRSIDETSEIAEPSKTQQIEVAEQQFLNERNLYYCGQTALAEQQMSAATNILHQHNHQGLPQQQQQQQQQQLAQHLHATHVNPNKNEHNYLLNAPPTYKQQQSLMDNGQPQPPEKKKRGRPKKIKLPKMLQPNVNAGAVIGKEMPIGNANKFNILNLSVLNDVATAGCGVAPGVHCDGDAPKKKRGRPKKLRVSSEQLKGENHQQHQLYQQQTQAPAFLVQHQPQQHVHQTPSQGPQQQGYYLPAQSMQSEMPMGLYQSAASPVMALAASPMRSPALNCYNAIGTPPISANAIMSMQQTARQSPRLFHPAAQRQPQHDSLVHDAQQHESQQQIYECTSDMSLVGKSNSGSSEQHELDDINNNNKQMRIPVTPPNSPKVKETFTSFVQSPVSAANNIGNAHIATREEHQQHQHHHHSHQQHDQQNYAQWLAATQQPQQEQQQYTRYQQLQTNSLLHYYQHSHHQQHPLVEPQLWPHHHQQAQQHQHPQYDNQLMPHLQPPLHCQYKPLPTTAQHHLAQLEQQAEIVPNSHQHQAYHHNQQRRHLTEIAPVVGHDVSIKSLSGLESLVDQIPNISERDASGIGVGALENRLNCFANHQQHAAQVSDELESKKNFGIEPQIGRNNDGGGNAGIDGAREKSNAENPSRTPYNSNDGPPLDNYSLLLEDQQTGNPTADRTSAQTLEHKPYDGGEHYFSAMLPQTPSECATSNVDEQHTKEQEALHHYAETMLNNVAANDTAESNAGAGVGVAVSNASTFYKSANRDLNSAGSGDSSSRHRLNSNIFSVSNLATSAVTKSKQVLTPSASPVLTPPSGTNVSELNSYHLYQQHQQQTAPVNVTASPTNLAPLSPPLSQRTTYLHQKQNDAASHAATIFSAPSPSRVASLDYQQQPQMVYQQYHSQANQVHESHGASRYAPAEQLTIGYNLNLHDSNSNHSYGSMTLDSVAQKEAPSVLPPPSLHAHTVLMPNVNYPYMYETPPPLPVASAPLTATLDNATHDGSATPTHGNYIGYHHHPHPYHHHQHHHHHAQSAMPPVVSGSSSIATVGDLNSGSNSSSITPPPLSGLPNSAATAVAAESAAPYHQEQQQHHHSGVHGYHHHVHQSHHNNNAGQMPNVMAAAAHHHQLALFERIKSSDVNGYGGF